MVMAEIPTFQVTYRTFYWVYTDPDSVTELNALGALGWRVVDSEPGDLNRNFKQLLLMHVVGEP